MFCGQISQMAELRSQKTREKQLFSCLKVSVLFHLNRYDLLRVPRVLLVLIFVSVK